MLEVSADLRPVFVLAVFNFGMSFFEVAFLDFPGSFGSVTSVILGFSLSSKESWNRVVLRFARGAGLGVELAGRAFGCLGGSLGMVLPFQAGIALGAPCDLLKDTLNQSQFLSQKKSNFALGIGKDGNQILI